MNIYLIGGLGADRNVWRNLKFGDEKKVHYLDWIQPDPSEPLKSYALRLSSAIDTVQPFYLIGLSFGGMLAAEISTQLQPNKTILISSIGSRKELPWYYKIAGRLGLYKIIPSRNPGKAIEWISSFFGVETAEDMQVFREMLKHSDPLFSKWAIKAILQWDRSEAPRNLVRIHGTKDHVLPLGNVTADYLLKGGGHFMVFNRAKEISKILSELGILQEFRQTNKY